MQLVDDHEVRRLEKPRKRGYLSVFGEHELIRMVYGSRETQRIEYATLDHRLQLPESKFSYLVQDWSQSLAVEMSYSQFYAVMNNVLNLEIRVSSLERMTRHYSSDAESYWDNSTATPAPQGQFVMATADGKGIPIHKASNDVPIADHDPSQKPKSDRKKMALLGAVYDN